MCAPHYQDPYCGMCSFTGNAGLCGIPGLPTCGPHLSVAVKIGIAFGALFALLLVVLCVLIWWKRRENILRARKIAAGKCCGSINSEREDVT